MKVLHVCDRLTPRVAKMAFEWQAQGRPCMVLYKHDCVPDLTEQILQVSRYLSHEMMMAKAAILSASCDLIHVHTSINSVGMLAVANANQSMGLVWDCHDWTAACSETLKHGKRPAAIITPSNGMRRHFKDLHDGPSEVIYSKVPKAWAPEPSPNHNRLVALNSAVEGPGGSVWRDYRQAQDMCDSMHMPMFIFPAITDPRDLCEYRNVMRQLPCLALWRELSQYHYGWAGAANDRHEIHDCVTNKFWEYLASGIPPITWRSCEMADIMREYYNDYAAPWIDRKTHMSIKCETDLRASIQSDDKRFMAAEMPKLLELYKRAMVDGRLSG